MDRSTRSSINRLSPNRMRELLTSVNIAYDNSQALCPPLSSSPLGRQQPTARFRSSRGAQTVPRAKPRVGGRWRASAAPRSGGLGAGARSARPPLTSSRGCLSAESEANGASYPAGPEAEHRRAVTVQR
jgi:hypothetical protein